MSGSATSQPHQGPPTLSLAALNLASVATGLEYSQARALLPTWTQQCDIDLACGWLESQRIPIPPLYARLRSRPLPPNSPVVSLLCEKLAPVIAGHLDDDGDILSVIYFMMTCKATWNALSGDVGAWHRRRLQHRYMRYAQSTDNPRVQLCKHLGERCINCSSPHLPKAQQENDYFVWPPRPQWAKLCHYCISGTDYSANANKYQTVNIENEFWEDLGEKYWQAVTASFSRGARFQIMIKIVRNRMYKPALLTLWVSSSYGRIRKLHDAIQVVQPRHEIVVCLTDFANALHNAVLQRRPPLARYRNALASLDKLQISNAAEVERVYLEIRKLGSQLWLRK